MGIVIRNANIYIGKGRFVRALLAEGGRIRRVGGDEEILAAAPPDARVIDAEGGTVIPGFNDSHMHLHAFGASMRAVRLAGASSVEEIVERGREFIERTGPKAGTAVLGGGWNQDYFTDGSGMPTRGDLDRISQVHPILFERVCGHVVACNSLALRLSGIDGHAPAVAGGRADVDEDGRPTGILRENAKELVEGLVQEPDAEDLAADLAAGMDYTCSRGITSIQSMDLTGRNSAQMLEAFERLEQSGKLKARINMQCNLDSVQQYLEIRKRRADSEYLKMGPLKLFADGSLGSRTAFLRNDYADSPGSRGIQVLSQRELDGLVAEADRRGIQVVVHAIGDAAVEEVLDSFEKVIRGGFNPLRHGLVHCQITDLALLRRMRALDVLALVQPVFLHYDLHMAESRVGAELASTSYAFRTMDELGIHVSYGTDAPVEAPDPFDNLHCAVSRQDLNGFPPGGFYPGERVDLCRALDNYTAGGAYASHEEKGKGSLEEGHCADLVLLDRDIFTEPSSRLRQTRVLMTVLGGEVVYEA